VGQPTGRITWEAHVRSDLLDRGQLDPVRENRQVPEQPPLGLGKQLVGPLDRGAERAVACLWCSRAIAKEIERAVQTSAQVS
jgi:hypothetical protein